MCGRFTRRVDRKTVAADFGLALDQVPELDPRYNVAPTQDILIVRQRSGAREAALARWGLIPSWANDMKIGYQLINARAETLASKPSFREAFKRRRCLVVADGFYEWQKTRKQKQPYHIRLVDDEPFGFAGLWETWHAPDGEVVESCTIVTTDANELVRPLHDRMPVILDRSRYAEWLDEKADPTTLGGLLIPFPAGRMSVSPVSTFVNNARNEAPACIEPATAA